MKRLKVKSAKLDILPDTLIDDFINAYNSLDVDKMLSCFTKDCIFENITNAGQNLKCNGIAELEPIARNSAKIFKSRQQKIIEKIVSGNKAAVFVEYHAVIAADMPNGMKAGQVLNLKAASFFEFEAGKIK